MMHHMEHHGFLLPHGMLYTISYIMKNDRSESMELSIILPTYNEEQGILVCLKEIKNTLPHLPSQTEVIIVDNKSTDKTIALVRSVAHTIKNLTIVEESERGYGAACLKGLREGQGKYLFIADADGTYNFTEIPRFLLKIHDHGDLVIGNRFGSAMQKGSMAWHHQYIGNPILSYLVRLFFKVKIHDIHCGARMISKYAFERLTLYTRGMEFASEMIIKAAQAHLLIEEIPITYRKRHGTSKLQSFSDGWRHLRFILLYSPLFLFIIPGLILFFIGTMGMTLVYSGNIHIFDIELFVHPLFFFAVMIIVGYQIIFFGAFSKTYAITHLGDSNTILEKLFKNITIEKAGFAGIIISGIGASIYLYIFIAWIKSGFGSLNEIKNATVALTLIVLGIQTFFSAFMLSIVGIKEK